MVERMTIGGIGPKLAALTFAYSLIPMFLTYRYPDCFILSFIPASIFKALGMILLTLGIPLWALSAAAIRKGFKEGVLCTRGVYSIVRHPLYSAIIVFIVPGILMFFRSWALFTIPLVAYSIFKRLIRREEEYLSEQFGEAYVKYKSRVNSVLPFPKPRGENG